MLQGRREEEDEAATWGFSSVGASGLPTYTGSIWFPVALWCSLFLTSASLHAAEISITTLYPWKVKEFAEEEGPTSPFQQLDNDITRVLTTVLVLTTVCQVASTMLYSLIVAALPQVSFSQATLFLTFFTLFFGELVPKALGVSNAEGVARAVVPSICFLAVFFSPIGRASTWLTKRVLGAFGVESGEVRAYVFQLFVAFSLPAFSLFLEEGCPSPRDLSALLLSCRRPNT